jgi:hypothetical protein
MDLATRSCYHPYNADEIQVPHEYWELRLAREERRSRLEGQPLPFRVKEDEISKFAALNQGEWVAQTARFYISGQPPR